MAIDLVFGSILLAFVGLGAWRGAVVTGSGLLALVCGYCGALLAATRASGWVASTLTLSPLIAPAVAGTLGFVLAWLAVSCLSDLAIAWDRQRTEHGRGPIDRTLGGLFGLLRGGLIVVLLAIGVSWLDAGRSLGAIQGLWALPDSQGSALVGASGDLVEAAVAGALSESGRASDVAARIVARPGRSLADVQSLLEDPRLEAMLADKLFWTLIQNDSVEYAMNRSAMRAIVLDPELRGRFVDLGLVDETAREDPDVFRAAVTEVLEEVAPRVHRFQHDPEIQALAQDPEIVGLLEAGDTLALIRHPKIRRIVERVSSTPAP